MASDRRRAGCLTLFLFAAGTSFLRPEGDVLRAAGPEAELTLYLNVVSTQELSARSAGALVAETNAIWQGTSLRLRWRTDESFPVTVAPGAADSDSLHVLLMARPVPAPGEPSSVAVGELVRRQGARPMAVASITAARRIVEEWRSLPLIDSPGASDTRLGVVLGRALAHEIGHYLLRTDTHASHGLMRARIDGREFGDVHSRAFRLDAAARAHLTALAAARSAGQGGDSFSYGPKGS